MGREEESAKENTPVRGEETPSAAPFISVMVLNYNYADLLVRALEACAAQTFRDFEVVMINNGAIDNTEEVYREFCAKHPEIKTSYVHVTPNLRAAHGWNEGLRYARGEYVMFHDADDWMQPDCLERLARAAMETGADRVSGQFQDVLPGGRVARVRRVSPKISMPTGMLQGVIFRHSVIEQNALRFDEGPNPMFYAYDVRFNFKFASVEKNRGVTVNRTVYNYLVYSASASDGALVNRIDSWMNQLVQGMISGLTDLKAATEDERIRDEAEYLVIKSAYGNIIKAFRRWDKGSATEFYDRVRKELDKKLPNWRKNPHIWPFGNGYALFDSLCLYALLWMDRLHLMGLIRFAGKMSKHLKFTR